MLSFYGELSLAKFFASTFVTVTIGVLVAQNLQELCLSSVFCLFWCNTHMLCIVAGFAAKHLKFY